MDTPTPVDLNKLKSILGNAKKIMSVTEEKFPSKTNKPRMNENHGYGNFNSSPIYDENDEKEMSFETHSPSLQNNASVNNIHKPMVYDEQAVINSKLPANIKEAMLKNPIPKLSGPPSKFTLEGLEELVEKPNRNVRQPLTENRSNQTSAKTITVSLDELNKIIDQRVEKKLNETLATMYNKVITEQAITKTIKTLMTEGKIKKK